MSRKQRQKFRVAVFKKEMVELQEKLARAAEELVKAKEENGMIGPVRR